MSLTTQLRIGGKPRPAASGATFERRNPMSGEVVTVAAAASEADAAAAVDAAASALPAWSALGPNPRRALLSKAADLLQARTPDFIARVAAETGATAGWAGFNVFLAAGMLREAASLTTHVTGQVIPSDTPGSYAFSFRQPAGVVLGIAPWNAPVILGVRALATPLACGNTVVFKASETCPATHGLIVEVLEEAGLPPGAVNLVTNAPADAPRLVESLIANPAVRRVNFTGSTQVGRRIAELAGRHLTPVLLELGGKAPLVILDDADLDAAVKATITACFLNAGQSCTAGERVLVDRAIHDEYLARLIDAVKQEVRLGHPEQATTTMGPLNNERTAAKAERQVGEAIERGAALRAGGRRAPELGSPLFFQPTVIDRVTEQMEIAREETFGPVVPITSIDGADEALDIVEESPYGLLTSVFTRDLARGLKFAESARAGWVNINEGTNYWESHLPFGGRAGSQSGLGRVGGRFSIERLTELKTIVVNLA